MRKLQSALFVDGTNVYAGQYSIFGPQRYLDFPKLIKKVENEIDVNFTKIYFYCSYSPVPKRANKKQKAYLKNEHFFYKEVKKTKKLNFFTGYRSKTSGKEKVVDVKLASDVVAFSVTGKYENIFVWSGDADFLEALFNVKKFGIRVKVNLICLENKIMHRGLHYFPTTILQFSNKNISQNTKKAKIIKLDPTVLVQSVA